VSQFLIVAMSVVMLNVEAPGNVFVAVNHFHSSLISASKGWTYQRWA